MKVLICGPVLTEKMEMKLSGASPASGKYLRNLKRGLELNGVEVSTISYITVPIEGDIREFESKNTSSGVYFFKDKYVLPSIFRFRKKLLSMAEKVNVVIFYNECYAYLGLVKKLSRRGIKSLLILADHTDSFECEGVARKLIAKVNEREYRSFEYSVILSENMKKVLKPSAKVILLEGGINISDYQFYSQPCYNGKLIIMYSGILSKVAGVDRLLSSFVQNNNKDIVLCISGKGELNDEVVAATKIDSRVKYLGYLSNEEFYERLSQANILVNPRNMSMEQNKNNFPSKVLEYLASGRIVISTRFAGYKRFKDNFYFYDGAAEEFNNIINIVQRDFKKLSETTFKKNREDAKNYDWIRQARKILDLISG